MLSLGGGGATQGLCGAFDLYCSIAFPTLGNLTKNLGPGVEAFAFFCADEWDQGTSSPVLVYVPANLELGSSTA